MLNDSRKCRIVRTSEYNAVQLEYPVLYARESYEIEGDYRDVLFMESLAMHQDKWWLYYGASEKYIALATAPIN